MNKTTRIIRKANQFLPIATIMYFSYFTFAPSFAFKTQQTATTTTASRNWFIYNFLLPPRPIFILCFFKKTKQKSIASYCHGLQYSCDATPLFLLLKHIFFCLFVSISSLVETHFLLQIRDCLFVGAESWIFFYYYSLLWTYI